MKVGVDAFTFHPYNLTDPLGIFEHVRRHDLEGVLLPGVRWLSPTLDRGQLREIRQEACRLGLYSNVSVGSPNAVTYQPAQSPDQLADTLTEEIQAAAAAGWHELHTCLGGLDERYRQDPPLRVQLKASADLLRRLRPVLRDRGCRLNLENHGDLSTFEIVRLVEEIGPDVLGCCLDVANVLCQAEDPLQAVLRAAPYTHMTHAKDAIIYFSDHGYTRQGRPPGQGVIPWEQVLPVLHHHNPDLELSIEDHKWVFEMRAFDADWLAANPDITPVELGCVMGLAWQCQKKIQSGELTDPQQYEAIPFAEQLVERLESGRDYLRALIERLGLKIGD